MNFAVKRLPIGIEFFDEMIKNQYYYVDKTGMISELLRSGGKVTLFTRPRRFGKSLNMSMLKNFFSLQGDKRIFNELQISRDKQVCEEYMGKFPVISISLKSVDGFAYRDAYEMLCATIGNEAMKFQYLMDSTKLTDREKEQYGLLIKGGDRIPFEMDEVTLTGSLKTLSLLLEKHHGKQTVLLIDEYDVPLSKASEHGYYKEMAMLIRKLFEQVLKTNESLKLAVLTGCMRISKESIFTGLNNFEVLSVADVRFDEYFGFTDKEVRKLLEYYHLSDKYQQVKEWYDGYQFGNVEVYCPWDVMNYCVTLLADPNAEPQNYWINTSSNEAVRRFIRESDNSGTIRREIEGLVAGECIIKELHQELTYEDMYQTIDNIWSVLFTTGYLTQRGRSEGNIFRLAIPNREIRNIFTTQIMQLFRENVKKDGELLNRFCEALENGNTESAEKCFGEYLRKTISIRDTSVRKEMKENFYHGILLGILGIKENWIVRSNRESGEGYSDILIETDDTAMGIVIEMKYAEDGNLQKAAEKALKQIESKQYEEALYDEGIEQILRYGIACYKKRCKILRLSRFSKIK
ncbi:AAA family ATPase [Blautia obeum]|uniref:AAA family ATPase n=1 Tax=Blautia obeum TaxID=40520 RepID=UPI00156DE81D|nr:AAA family ATPase [Blautia obeum]NSG39987.1 AAA family ATPase [Blautia obeum]